MKSKGKKSPRIIYLNDTALAISSRLNDEFPEGELFRNAAGRAWSTEAVNCVFDRIQVRMGKKILLENKQEPSEKEIASLTRTLAQTKTLKGIRRDKRPAEPNGKESCFKIFALRSSAFMGDDCIEPGLFTTPIFWYPITTFSEPRTTSE